MRERVRRSRSKSPCWRDLATAGGLIVAAACVSYDVTLDEFDSVARIDQAESWPRAADYRDDPARLSWVLRRLSSFGPTRTIVDYAGAEPGATKIDNPSGFARDSFTWLAENAADDPNRTAQVAARLLWVAELDREQPYNRSRAVDGIALLLEQLGRDPREIRFADPSIATEDRIAEWLATLNAGWPVGRRGQPLPEDRRAAYLETLAAITELPLPTPPASATGALRPISGADQRALIRALAQAVLFEVDPALLEPTRQALSRALYHGLMMALHRALYDPSALVRETAIRSLHRLSGPDGVPFILKLIEKPSAIDPSTRYDADRFVRLTLIRMCGQLGRSSALQRHADGPAPIELLYETFFADPDPGLRQIALQALAQSLGRPIDFDGSWAEQWWREDYVPNRRTAADR